MRSTQGWKGPFNIELYFALYETHTDVSIYLSAATIAPTAKTAIRVRTAPIAPTALVSRTHPTRKVIKTELSETSFSNVQIH